MWMWMSDGRTAGLAGQAEQAEQAGQAEQAQLAWANHLLHNKYWSSDMDGFQFLFQRVLILTKPSLTPLLSYVSRLFLDDYNNHVHYPVRCLASIFRYQHTHLSYLLNY